MEYKPVKILIVINLHAVFLSNYKVLHINKPLK